MKSKMLLSLPAAVLSLAFAPNAFASTTWYVNGVNGSDSDSCTAPTSACKTIGHAISLAASGDSITVAPATYSENLTIGISLKLLGSGATTTVIDGGGRGTVLTISNSAALVTLVQLTVRNGHAVQGGGVNNSGTLTIISSSIISNYGNQGGGIYNHGTLTVNNIVVGGNTASHPSGCKAGCGGFGAGIFNYENGTLTLINSTVDGNTSTTPSSCILGCGSSGGGIYNSPFGTVTVNRSTISNNKASEWTSRSGAGGGGIENAGTITVNNSTIAYNSASGWQTSGGGINNESTAAQTAVLTINNGTLAMNKGGGVNNSSGTAIVQNSVFADNSPGGDCIGTIISSGYNLSSDNTCSFDGPGNFNNIDPRLGTLGYYGGPTQTIPLLSGSPAIDAGNPSGCTDGHGNLLKTDQRGMPRPDSEDKSGCDIGAYESQSD